MDLRTYLFLKDIKLEKFAKDLGCSYGHILQIKNNKRKPSLMLAKAIEKATGFQVRAESFMKKTDIFEQYNLPLEKT